MSSPGRVAAPTAGAGAGDDAGGPGWAAHLRAGGTTPWLAWLEGHGPAGERPPRTPHRALPGAQQLELLRRLNAAGRPSPALAERVLAAGGTGRGRLDLDLVGDGPDRAYGAPPVDPAGLPAEDLLRVAVGLVADDLLCDRVAPPATARRLPALPRRRRHRIVGDPRLALHLRAEATRRRRRLGGPPDRVLVLGAGHEQALADLWCARFLGPGAPPWDAWLRGWVERDADPPRADPAALAQQWVARLDADRVHVVLDPDALPRLLDARRLSPAPPPPTAGAAELSRRVAAVLGVLTGPDERRRLVGRVLLPWLGTLDAPGAGAPPAVPAWAEPWLERRARVLRDALGAGDYRVHGDPDALLERTRGGPAGPAPALAVAVAALLAADPPRTSGRGDETDAEGRG